MTRVTRDALHFCISDFISSQINDQGLDHLESLEDAQKLLNSHGAILSMTLAKSCNAINSIIPGPLSSSSSGHNMQEQDLMGELQSEFLSNHSYSFSKPNFKDAIMI